MTLSPDQEKLIARVRVFLDHYPLDDVRAMIAIIRELESENESLCELLQSCQREDTIIFEQEDKIRAQALRIAELEAELAKARARCKEHNEETHYYENMLEYGDNKICELETELAKSREKHTDRYTPCPKCDFVIVRREARPFTFDDETGTDE